MLLDRKRSESRSGLVHKDLAKEKRSLGSQWVQKEVRWEQIGKVAKNAE